MGTHKEKLGDKVHHASPTDGYVLCIRLLHTPSLRVFMATLRKKLEVDPSHPQYIQTHIGVGYRMIRQKQEDEA